jgi:hypothetical protein
VVRDVNRRRAVDGGGVALVGWVTIKGGQGTHFIKYKTTTTIDYHRRRRPSSASPVSVHVVCGGRVRAVIGGGSCSCSF